MSLQNQETKLSSWAEAAVVRTTSGLEALVKLSSDPFNVRKALQALSAELDSISATENYDHRFPCRAVLKKSYGSPAVFPTNHRVFNTMHILPDNCLAIGSDSLVIYKFVNSKLDIIAAPWSEGAFQDLQLIPGGRLISSHPTGEMYEWTQGKNGVWSSTLLGSRLIDTNFQFLPSGHVVGGRSDQFKIGRIADSKFIVEDIYRTSIPVSAVCVLTDGRIVAALEDGKVAVYNANRKTSARLKQFERHTQAVRCLKALPDGGFLTASLDGTLRVWKVGEKQIKTRKLVGHSLAVTDIQVLDDGRFLSSSKDSTVVLWKESGRSDKSRTWRGKPIIQAKAPIDGMRVFPDGKIVLALSGGRIALYDGEVCS